MTFIGDDLNDAFGAVLEHMFLHISSADLAKVISKIEPDAVTGNVTRCEIAHSLGEYGDIWPEAIRNHTETAEVIHLRP